MAGSRNLRASLRKGMFSRSTWPWRKKIKNNQILSFSWSLKLPRRPNSHSLLNTSSSHRYVPKYLLFTYQLFTADSDLPNSVVDSQLPGLKRVIILCGSWFRILPFSTTNQWKLLNENHKICLTQLFHTRWEEHLSKCFWKWLDFHFKKKQHLDGFHQQLHLQCTCRIPI